VTLLGAVGSFAVVAGLLTLVPGLDTALVLRAAVSHGRRAAFATALGVAAGVLVWGAAAAVGISALLLASHTAYTVLRIAGAICMVALGARLVRAAVRRSPPATELEVEVAPGVRAAWTRGFVTNLLNPKVGAFYVAVLPSFIPADAPHLAVGLLLALVHDLEGLAWFTLLICAAHGARSRLASERVRRSTDAVTGSVLLAFGSRLAVASK
jgi:threonine/homoserine/homoserine lactone efflux protein